MRKSLWVFFGFVLAIWTGIGMADELLFPKTEDEIVKALNLKDGKVVHEGVEYLSETGRVWKIIDGKRFRVRGFQGIRESSIVPKAGALINFDTNSSKIKPNSHSLLDEFGKALKGGLAEATIVIAGHTDSTGTDDYNMKLSLKRAEAVTNYLKNHHGILSEHLLVEAYGRSKAMVSNNTEEGRALNRRVEFIRVE